MKSVEELTKINFRRLILNILKIYHTVTFKIQLREIQLCYHPRLHCLILYIRSKKKWISVRDKSLEISKAGGTTFFSNLIIHNSYFILQKLIPTKKHIFKRSEKNDRLWHKFNWKC